MEYSRAINIKKERAPEVKRVAEQNSITLTCHAPYFINLNSEEKKTYHASVSYIVNSARISFLCGAQSVAFHAGYYMKKGKEQTYEKIKIGVKEIIRTLKDEDIKIWIRPEISGRVSQFGDLNELIKLSQEVDQVMPCIDFAHLHARAIGDYNKYDEFVNIFEQLEKGLGKEALKSMHIHITGIAYSDKGEKHHLNLKESDFNYKDLCKVWKDFKIEGIVISESPNIEEDALLVKKEYERR